MRALAGASVALVALAGCATSAPSDGLVASAPAAQTRLVVEQTTDRTQTWTLTCDPPGGDHPSAAAACGALAGVRDPFAPLPADVLCTEVYGGPQTARVTGTYRGAPVDLALSRTDGCRISQWERLGPLLPGPVGGDAPK
jgi:hypothetical protein